MRMYLWVLLRFLGCCWHTRWNRIRCRWDRKKSCAGQLVRARAKDHTLHRGMGMLVCPMHTQRHRVRTSHKRGSCIRGLVASILGQDSLCDYAVLHSQAIAHAARRTNMNTFSLHIPYESVICLLQRSHFVVEPRNLQLQARKIDIFRIAIHCGRMVSTTQFQCNCGCNCDCQADLWHWKFTRRSIAKWGTWTCSCNFCAALQIVCFPFPCCGQKALRIKVRICFAKWFPNSSCYTGRTNVSVSSWKLLGKTSLRFVKKFTRQTKRQNGNQVPRGEWEHARFENRPEIVQMHRFDPTWPQHWPDF